MKKLKFTQLLPDYFGHDHDHVPPDLVGSRIVNFGTVEGRCVFEGGGLVVRYIPKGSSSIKTVVFEFTELGMWVNGKNALAAEIEFPNLDALPK